jgi:hypothetical protein
MSRLLKMKRQVILEANRKLLNESLINVDNVLEIMKFKFGWGDLSPLRVEEFESWLGEVKDNMSEEEYSTLFNEWLETGSIEGYNNERYNNEMY